MAYIKKPRSVSQYNQYFRCPQAYNLARIVLVWQRPAAWLQQGTAVHEVAELYEKRKLEGGVMTLEEAQEAFKESYARDINAACQITPNLQFWSRSGPYAGPEDIERRFGIGLEQVEKFINWTESNGLKIWVAPDGTPGIELHFKVTLGMDPSCPVHAHGIKDDDCDCGVGPIVVQGYIDAVVVDEDGNVKVIDYKTGKSPGDDFQLGVYGVALQLMFGIEPPQEGAYWMGQSGKLTYPYDISEWTIERVTEEFIRLEEALMTENYEADPEPNKCQFCDVSASCDFALG